MHSLRLGYFIHSVDKADSSPTIGPLLHALQQQLKWM
jgi:hypothetical protein